MKKILVIFGTRPEIIKLAPVIHELQKNNFEVVNLHTGQHDELAKKMLQLFDINPDYNLDGMNNSDNLNELSSFLIPEISKILGKEKPDSVIVQGDTTSAYLGALTSFYSKIPVYHVEAGLRSFDRMNPFPEEINRKQISVLASHHFAPTGIAYQNLINEGISEKLISNTGNTVIDSLLKIRKSDEFDKSKPRILDDISEDLKLIVVTAHRRENHGEPLRNIMKALVDITKKISNVLILCPAHPSPQVQKIISDNSYSNNQIKIIPPLSYLEFQHVMDRADVILTDSGGIQEEAAALGKHMLVLREATERQELVDSGFTQLVGSDSQKITIETLKILNSKSSLTTIKNPYGDGNSAKKIVSKIREII